MFVRLAFIAPQESCQVLAEDIKKYCGLQGSEIIWYGCKLLLPDIIESSLGSVQICVVGKGIA